MGNAKEPLKLGIILGIISFILALMLAFVNDITKDRIAMTNAKILQDGLKTVMPYADHFIPMNGTDLENSYKVEVKQVYLAMDKDENVIGYCATVMPKGYDGEIETIVGMDLSSVITGVEVTSNMTETAGLGAKAMVRENFNYQFEGKQMPFALKKDGGELDGITSATITSRAVTSGVNAAAEVMNKNSIYGSFAQDGEIIDGIYVIPAEKPEEEQDSENGEETTEEGRENE